MRLALDSATRNERSVLAASASPFSCWRCPPPRARACRRASSICATWRRPSRRTSATPASDNFTGDVLPGYAAEECILRREAALALAQVAKDLAPQHLGLKVYDCYRPERAVAAMWRWAHDGKRDGDKRFYPNVDKRELFSLGYIAAHSRHSTGTAVDVTLVRQPAPRPVMRPPRARQRLHGAAGATRVR